MIEIEIQVPVLRVVIAWGHTIPMRWETDPEQADSGHTTTLYATGRVKVNPGEMPRVFSIPSLQYADGADVGCGPNILWNPLVIAELEAEAVRRQDAANDAEEEEWARLEEADERRTAR